MSSGCDDNEISYQLYAMPYKQDICRIRSELGQCLRRHSKYVVSLPICLDSLSLPFEKSWIQIPARVKVIKYSAQA